jgi:hypothetical protein
LKPALTFRTDQIALKFPDLKTTTDDEPKSKSLVLSRFRAFAERFAKNIRNQKEKARDFASVNPEGEKPVKGNPRDGGRQSGP